MRAQLLYLVGSLMAFIPMLVVYLLLVARNGLPVYLGIHDGGVELLLAGVGRRSGRVITFGGVRKPC